MVDSSELPEGKIGKFKTKPYNHQLVFLNKFGRKEVAALLAEQGTGKTWMIINNVADLWASNDCDALLVLAPNGVHYNWTIIELPKHMPDWVRWRAAAWSADANKKEKAELERLYDQADGELRILTMNWEALQTKRGLEAAERFCNTSRRLMIACDESDNIKNPTAIRTKSLMKLRKFSHWRRIMTGTPIDGSPFAAFSQFSFLDEHILGTTSYYAFKAEYAEMLPPEHHLMQHIAKEKSRMSGADKLAIYTNVTAIKEALEKNGRQELIDVINKALTACEDGDYDELPAFNQQLRSMFSDAPSSRKTACLQLMAEIDRKIIQHQRNISIQADPRRLPQIPAKNKETGRPKYRNLDKLSALIAPHSFRVLKSECLDLPDKIYKTVFFDMTKEQKEIYNKAEKECRLVFEGEETSFNKLVAVTKLAQITSGYYIHPLSEEPVRIPGDNPKIEMLAERVQAIIGAGEKVIIWARYRIEIEDLAARLDKDGHRCVEYHGGVKKGDRIDAIEQFENGDADVFIGNQQAGGTGITLIAASHVIYFSNDFSLRNRLQSEDRAHRIGQTKNVNYVNIAARNTIDESVIKALLDKKDVADEIVDRGLKLFS